MNCGLKIAGPERVRAEPTPGIEHEGGDAGNQHQADPGGRGVDPAHRRVVLWGQPAPIVIEREGRGDFQDEEDVLRRPTEDERADEHFGRQRRRQPDGPPNPHAGDRAEHDRQEDEEAGVTPQVGQIIVIAGTIGKSRLDGQEQPAAHRIVGNQDMHDRNRRDQHRRGQIRDVPPEIVHGATPKGLFAR